MADGKIGVGATIGIVLGVTAVLGVGLYFILRPKSSTSSVTPVYYPPATNNTELESYKAQLEILKQQNENAKGAAKAQTDAQIQGILIATGGKIATSFLDKWLAGLDKPKNTSSNQSNLLTSPSTPAKNPYLLDYDIAFTGFTGNQW